MKLKLIQERVVDALEQNAYFAGKTMIVAEDKGDVANKLQQSMMKTKCGILVQTPGFNVTSNASKIMVGNAPIAVQVLERVLENRVHGGPTAQDMAEVAAWSLNMLPVEGVGVLVCKNISSEMLEGNVLAYTVNFDVQTTLSDPLDTRKEEAV